MPAATDPIPPRSTTAHDAERARIARDVHDELGQYLTALRTEAALLRARFGANPALARQAETMTGLVDEAFGALRDLLTALRPGAPEQGLVAATAAALARLARRSGITTRLHAPKSLQRVGDPVGSTAWRIVQEALTNVARHAQARQVSVRLQLRGRSLLLCIEDDGVGMAAGACSCGLGLRGMVERALVIGGHVRIDSRPGAGTTVRALLPVAPRGADRRPPGRA